MLNFKTTYGIQKCHPAELAPDFYKMRNCWKGVVDGKQVIVYAGALRHNAAKGVLVMRTLPTDSRRIGGRHCVIPAGSGALQIVEVRASRLRISMEKGGSFWFEIPGALNKAA